MFGRFLRAAGSFAVVMLGASIMTMVLDKILPIISNSQHLDNSDKLLGGFQAVNEWFIFFGLISCLILILAGAVIEATLGRSI